MVVLKIENHNEAKCKHESVTFTMLGIQLKCHNACLILARNYNSPRTVSVKVLTLPMATEPTLRAIKHL